FLPQPVVEITAARRRLRFAHDLDFAGVGVNLDGGGVEPRRAGSLDHPLDVAVLELMQHVRHGNPPCHPITKRPPPLAHRPRIVNNPLFLQENFQGVLKIGFATWPVNCSEAATAWTLCSRRAKSLQSSQKSLNRPGASSV